MKVRELIAALSKFDPNTDVLGYSEDEALLLPGHGFRILEIVNVDETEGERTRIGDDEVPTLKLGKSDHSRKFVTLEVAADF